MQTFATSEIAELAHQLTMSPVRLRLKQLDGIERLLGMVKPEASYPYELVCYHITEYRPRGRQPRASLLGRKLIGDLVLMAEHISRKANVPIANVTEPHFSQEALAEHLNVSTKTIRRWRGRGLMGVRVVCEDGVNRQVFLAKTVARFREQHAELVKRGAAFKQLSDRERGQMVERARELLSARRRKLHDVAQQIAGEMGRAVETVRYTLRRYDQNHPSDALFANGGMPRVSQQHLVIWKSYRAGQAAEQIAAACDCDVESVEQILREMKVRRLKAKLPTYVYSEEFAAPNADAIVLGPEPAPEPGSARRA